MQIKKELRKEYKLIRKNIADKKIKDDALNEKLVNSKPFKNSDTVLFYAALEDEVNVDTAIKFAFEHNKKVALPVCIDNDGKMQYYYIKSFDDVIIGSFGVREPDINKFKLCDDFNNSICIVPAIAFDKRGYRLGYGKGYYDRFLENYNFTKVGITYDETLVSLIPNDRYDIAVDYIVTQNGIITV